MYRHADVGLRGTPYGRDGSPTVGTDKWLVSTLLASPKLN
jgi:hypothetical protein